MQKDKTKKHTRMIFAAAVCIVLMAAAFMVCRLVNHREIITFGSYEQDNDASDGTEPIEWIVLKRKGNRALIISRYALDAQPFQTATEYATSTWENCTLRKWLNDDFFQEAFTANEQEKIMTTTIKSEGTEDTLFLLSQTEVKHYFLTQSKRCCQATAYAEAQSVKHGENEGHSGSNVDSSSKKCIWWLRTPGYFGDAVASVCVNGKIETLTAVDDGAVCVRPVMWISLEN